MMILRSCVIFTGNNIFSDSSALLGGSLCILDSVVTLSGINTFMNNTSPKDTFDSQCLSLEDDVDESFRGLGGAIYCRSSILSINSGYSVFADNFANNFGGAITSWDGNITIEGSVIFMENVANEYEGGALFLVSVTLIVSGNISFIKNKAYSGGALSISRAKFILIVDEERMANEKFIYNDASDLDFCRSVAMNGKTTSIDAEYVRVLDSYNCNFNDSGKGMALFYENMAILEGGGIKCESDCDIIIFDGSIHFENNSAMFGGGIYLGDNSRIIISSSIPNAVSFVLNHAHRFGGALYVGNSQCSTQWYPKECFLSIYGDNLSTATKSLFLFLNNSVGFKGSILYGGQLNKCRVRFISHTRIDKYGSRVADYINQYDLDALVIFKNISRIKESESASSIASNPQQMKFCQLEGIPKNQTLDLYVYPGEEFNISVIALDQTGSPVPTTVFVEKGYHEYYQDDDNNYYYFTQLMDQGDNFPELMDKYRLSPSRQSINGHFCTNLTYKLYSAYEDTTVYFHLYYENPCQNLVYGLRLNIFIEPCPLGFELAKNQQCHCNKRLLQFTQICSVDKSTVTIIKREKNNFWISQTNFDTLVIHEFRCPLDYCKDILSEDVILSDPSVQCDFNRTGIVCAWTM